ncbi:210_t:CDS:1 [Funneliformis geosporum]|uniref:210_t:CDS:1 n=1 Tax=Funneliformis geosporum TaxID=1117311 RepID=A0A9W4WX33_9GLOM|nr:210_t:CDS:1 [Funneliformis geosporum]
MFRFTSFIKFHSFKCNGYVRNFQSTSRNILTTNPIFEPVDLIQSKFQLKTKYSKEEIRLLNDAVKEHGKSWELISEHCFFSTRTPRSLLIKWNDLNKSFKDKEIYTKEWTEEEDNILLEKIIEFGVGDWSKISEYLHTKDRKQICKRYIRLSAKSSQKGEWTIEEDHHLFDLVAKFGKQWITFSQMLDRPCYNISYRYFLLTNSSWTHDANIKLRNAILNHGENWFEISKLFPNRKLNNIKLHYKKHPKLNPLINVGKWKAFEIERFEIAVNRFGKIWKKVAKYVETRTPLQCYTHWNYLTKKSYNIKSY